VKELPDSHILDQYGNPSNPQSHYEHTAEEILQQCDNKVDMLVIAAGTGGTISGIAKKFKERLPHCKIIGVDPVGSILAGPGPISTYKVEGIGYDFIPNVLDCSLVDEWVKTEDKESFLMARRLIREEGMMCGGSSGSALVAALLKAKELKKGQRCVFIVADSVRNYMSKFLDYKWMVDWGYEDAPKNPKLGGRNVADLHLPTPTALPATASCKQAVEFLHTHNVRVVPAIGAAKELLGVVTDEGLMNYLCNDGTSAADPISQAFAAEYREISPETSLDQLRFILSKEGTAFVTQAHHGKKELLAVVTKYDLCAALLQDK